MKASRVLIAIAFLILPVVARVAWFYHGIYQRSTPVSTPDFASIALPQFRLSTPLPTETSAPVGRMTVAIDQNHNNLFSLSEIASLTQILTNRGIRLEISDNARSLEAVLKASSSLIVVAPSTVFTNDEKLAITEFVQRGGHLLVIADPTRDYSFSSSAGGSVPAGQIGSATGPDVALPQPQSATGGGVSYSAKSVDAVNFLLALFDITISDDYVYNLVNNEGNFRNVIVKKFENNDLTDGLSSLVFYSAHSIKSSSPPLVSADDSTYSSITDKGGNLGMVASGFNGRVLVIGDLTFFSPPYNAAADNEKFIYKIADFLSPTTMIKDLAVFPRLFQRPVTVVLLPELEMDKGLLGSLAGTQKLLLKQGIPMTISDKTADGRDEIIFGTFTVTKESDPWINEFGIDFDPPTRKTPVTTTPTITPDGARHTPTPEPIPTLKKPAPKMNGEDSQLSIEPMKGSKSIMVPGFGILPTDGLGLVLFKTSEQRNSLILMAENPASLQELLQVINSEDLSGCMLQGQVAACKLLATTKGEG